MPVNARATPRRSVLIVDDDRSTPEAMEAALAGEFRVSSATDAPSAQKILDRGPSDLPPAAQATAEPIEEVNEVRWKGLHGGCGTRLGGGIVVGAM